MAEAKSRLSELIHQAERRPQVIERRGEPVAVAVRAAALIVDLLDTNVISELPRPRPNAGVVAWIESLLG